MHRDMKIMSDLPVADVVPSSTLTEDQRSKASDFTDEKSLESGSRLSVKGFEHWIQDLDDTFASIPVLMILKRLLVFALSMQWRIFTFDITTARLHAILNPDDDPIFVWPPEEYFPYRNLVWRLKQALYGL